MKGSLLGYSNRKFKASSVQVQFALIFPFLLIAMAMSSCGFVDEAGKGVNTPPSVSVQAGDFNVNERSPVTLTSSITDDFANIKSVNWQQTKGPHIQLQNADSSQASFTAPVVLVHESPVQLEFRIIVKDNFGQQGSDTVVVLVSAVNTLPVANDDGGLVVNEGQPGGPATVINVTDNDSDGDGSVSLSGIKVVTAPQLGRAIPNDDGTISYVHNGTEPSAELGTDTDSFTYRVKDNETVLADEQRLGEARTYSNEATVSMTIAAVNDPPVAETATVVLDEGQKASGKLTATDADSEIVFFLVNNGALGAASITNEGAFSYVPRDNDVNGGDQFTFGVREIDGEELESTALVSVTINPVNDAPRITTRPVRSGREETPYVYNISATDVEGNAMVFSTSALPNWLTLRDNGDGTAVLSGTPGDTDAGSYNIAVRVTDNGSPPKTGAQVFSIKIADSNLAPNFTSKAVTSATEGQRYTYNIRATDPNGDALTITAPTLPDWLSLIDNGNGTAVLSGTPAEDDAGNHPVTLRVTDDGTPALVDDQSFVIVVGESNEAPSFTTNAVTSASENQLYTYNVRATDPNDDTLKFTAPTLPSWLSLIDNGDGTAVLSGTPGGNNTGNHNVTLQVTDNGSPPLSANQSFIIVVGESNEPPRFISNPVTTAAVNQPYRYDISATDSNGDTLKIAALASPGWLSLTDNGNGTAVLSGTPGGDDAGSHNVTLQVADNGSPSLSANQSFNIVVEASNQAPVANNDSVNVILGASAIISVLGNDTDADGTINPQTVVVVTQPTSGTAVANTNGTVTYTSDGSNILGDSFTYTVQDNDGATSNAATVSLILISLDGFDAQNVGCWTTAQEQALLASVADPEASPLAMYSLVSDGTKGTVSITDPLTGAFRYDPYPEGERGTDTFTYRIDDPNNEVKLKTATVIIHPKIMFVGDSITAGLSDSTNQLPAPEHRGGFRKPFYDALSAEEYWIDLMGSQSDGSGIKAFDPQHEAYSNWTVLELAYGRNPENSEGVYAWLEANPSDILLVHAGSYGLSASASPLANLLDEVDRWEASANGHPVTVVVARIIDQNPSDLNISLFNGAIAAIVRSRSNNPDDPAYPDDVLIADLHHALSYPHDLSDRLHPNAQGYAKMADVWKDVVTENLLLQRCPE